MGEIRHYEPSNEYAVRTLTDVAEIMTRRGYPMTKQAVRDTEQRAIRKLRSHEDTRRLLDEVVE